jgi:hypothetical protein
MNASADRTAYRATIATIADKARAKLPESASRIDAAVKLVLLGEVTLVPDGTARVGSCTDVNRTYTVNGTCDCKDVPKAPHGWCKHRLSVAITRRVQELTAAASPLDVTPKAFPPGPVPALPEAPVSINVRLMIDGRDCQLTLRGTAEEDVLARLEKVLHRYPVALAHPQGSAPTPTPMCSVHGPLKPSTKGKGWFCAHKLDDDTWCPSKGT